MPRTGFRGFFETIADYFSYLIKGNLLTIGCCLPSIALFFAARILTQSIVSSFILAQLGAPLVGAGLCALNGIVCNSIRNRGFNFWRVYKKDFVENFPKGTYIGVMYIASVELTLCLPEMFDLWRNGGRNNSAIIIMFYVLIVAIRILLSYLCPMMTLIELPVKHYLKNGMLMIPACFKATMLTGAISSFLYFLMVFMLPLSSPFIIVFAFSLDTLICQMWIWPAINATLSVEAREQQKNSEKD